MKRWPSAICSRDNLVVSNTFICSNLLKSKMSAFLAFFKIHQFHPISFPKAPPGRTVSSRNNIPPLMDLLMRERYISTCIHFQIKVVFLSWDGGTVGRGSQVSDRSFKEPSKGILADGIKRGSLAAAVKESRDSDLSLFPCKIWT